MNQNENNSLLTEEQASTTGLETPSNPVSPKISESAQKGQMPANPLSPKTPESAQKPQMPANHPTHPRPPMPGTLTAEEKWERADLTDSFIFYKVMTENPDACRRLLERLLHVSIEKIEILGEKSLGIDSESKGIRLDVYVKDEERVFDVEMQVKNTGELPERAISSLEKLQFFEATLKKRVANRAILTGSNSRTQKNC